MGLSTLAGTSIRASDSQHLIRRCTLDDVDFLLQVAEHRYGPADFDRKAVKAWLIERIPQDSIIAFFRGRHSAGCCHVGVRYMAPTHLQCYLTVIASIPQKSLSMEPFRILEHMVDWARSKGATKFWFSDITGNDLAPFVRHLGAREAGRNYVVDLDPDAGRYG
jgi:hypothetical protein